MVGCGTGGGSFSSSHVYHMAITDNGVSEPVQVHTIT